MRVHAQRLCVMNVHNTAMAVLSVDMKIVIMALSWHCHEGSMALAWAFMDVHGLSWHLMRLHAHSWAFMALSWKMCS